jgi:small-conductance mechanosensitive channel
MSALPYNRQEGDDTPMLPLDRLRPPIDHPNASYMSTASDANPPLHHIHPHGFSNEHFYQGIEPGYQGDPTEDISTKYEAQKASYSKSDQYDKVIDKDRGHDQRDAKGRLHQQHHETQAEGHQSDSDDETDDFDWDTSEDEDPEASRFDAKLIRAKRGRKLYLALMQLARPVRIFSIGLVGTVIALVPFIVMLAAFRNSPARAQVETWSIWIAIIWATSCSTFIVVDWTPPLMLRIGVAFYGKAPETFKTGIEILIAVKIWLKLVLCISWAWISLGGVTAISFSSPDRPRYFKWVFRVLQALFGTSILILVEKMLLQAVAIHFHKVALKDRLENNRAAIKALDGLHESIHKSNGRNNKRTTGHLGRAFGWASASGSPTPNFLSLRGQSARPAEDRDPRHSPTAQRKQHSPTTERDPRRPNFASQLTDALATATMKSSRLYRGGESKSQLSARRLAKELFSAIGHHRQSLIADDFYPFFGKPEDAQAAFKHFDADNNGDISKTEMRDAVQNIYRERRSLSTQIKDMSSAVSKLDGVLLGVVLVVIIFLWLLIFNGSNTVANIAPLSTFVVSFSFIFGNSAKTLFESMVFIFATHPYDVGDLVCVDDNFMFVTSFGLISTTFRTVVNEYIVVPNSLLASQKMIFNCRRSGSQWETTSIQVGYDSTLLEVIDELRSRMRAWVKSRDREWGGGFEVNIDQMETSSNAISLVLAMEHKGNWQDWGSRWSRRTQLMRLVKSTCEELGIKYQLPLQPVSFHGQSGEEYSSKPRSGSSPPSSAGPRPFSAARGTPRPVGGVGNLQYTKAQLSATTKKK